MRKKNKRILAFIGLFAIVVFVAGFSYVYLSDPLRVDGVTNYDNERKKLLLSVVNEGKGSLHLKKVQVNGSAEPQQAELGMSYSMQLVLGGIEGSPQAAFVGLDEEPITPARKAKDVRDIIDSKMAKPIHYGIRIVNDTNMNDVTITYRYFGITKTKRIDITQ
ncbi:hypothetical protein [Paenibacillus spongiae]|uniref:DUF5067 domain-containing protein n=1 Tax=Paenibacillus spongiae TaxID=2909671 RepID=A0ABY5SFY6_9BACL|nr:hypothetical protein [Paenibacillus spongiae]UVI32891.1 hypothetical protein L1F29_14110 [Paenibacillus spongiae]